MARTARFSLQLTEEEDLKKKSQMISWIAEGEEIEKIDVTKSVERKIKDKICSDFQESLSVDGISFKRVYTITGGKLDDLVCKV
jgi:hypothetical protein